MRTAFNTVNPPSGLTESVRRALSQINTETEEIRRLEAACKKLKLKPELKVHEHDCWAHIGLRDKLVAIYLRDFIETARITKERTAWERHGWKMLAITNRQVSRMSDDEIVAQLRAALVELGKLK